MTLESVSYTLPAHWAGALINDDRTGLEDADEQQLDALLEGESLPSPVDCSDEPFFCVHHDARQYGVLPCDCLEFAFLLVADPSSDPDQ